MNRSMSASLLFGALLLIGCAHVRVHFPSVPPAEAHTTWVNGFLWGTVGGHASAEAFCGDRPVAQVDTMRSAGNTIVSWLTLGIYTPMQAIITCGQQPGLTSGYQPYYAPPAQPYSQHPMYPAPGYY